MHWLMILLDMLSLCSAPERVSEAHCLSDSNNFPDVKAVRGLPDLHYKLTCSLSFDGYLNILS